MSLFFKDDPVFSVLKAYKANILDKPDGRIVPLGIIEQPLMGTAKFRTTLEHILSEGSAFDIGEDDLETSYLAGISGEKTNFLSSGLVLKFLSGLLQTKSSNTSEVPWESIFSDSITFAYTFDRLERTWIDNGLLAKELEFRSIRRNALTECWFGLAASKLLLIDSVIVCKDFSIEVKDSSDGVVVATIKAISQKVGALKSQFQIVNTEQYTISFESEIGLPIAFTTLHLELDSNGKIVGMPAKLIRKGQVYGFGHEGELEKTTLETKAGSDFVGLDYT